MFGTKLAYSLICWFLIITHRTHVINKLVYILGNTDSLLTWYYPDWSGGVQKLSGAVFCTRGKTDGTVSNQWGIGIMWVRHKAAVFPFCKAGQEISFELPENLYKKEKSRGEFNRLLYERGKCTGELNSHAHHPENHQPVSVPRSPITSDAPCLFFLKNKWINDKFGHADRISRQSGKCLDNCHLLLYRGTDMLGTDWHTERS